MMVQDIVREIVQEIVREIPREIVRSLTRCRLECSAEIATVFCSFSSVLLMRGAATGTVPLAAAANRVRLTIMRGCHRYRGRSLATYATAQRLCGSRLGGRMRDWCVRCARQAVQR